MRTAHRRRGSEPVNEYISWVKYSSYANGTFTPQWTEEFDAATLPTGWVVGNFASPYNLSVHSPSNVNFASGIAVLSVTADPALAFLLVLLFGFARRRRSGHHR